MPSLDYHALLTHPQVRPEAKAAIRKAMEGTAAKAVPDVRNRGGIVCEARKQGQLSKTERLFEIRLQSLQQAGQIQGYDYEAVRLKLADPAGGVSKSKWFKVDFTVYHGGNVVSFDEVKGVWASQRSIERFRWLCDRFEHLWLRLWQFDKGVWRLKLESGKAE